LREIGTRATRLIILRGKYQPFSRHCL